MEQKDYLLKVKVQNNNIISLMKQKGISSNAELARLCGVSNSDVGDFVNMTRSPLTAESIKCRVVLGWVKSVEKMAAFFNVPPECLFNEQQLWEPVESNKSEVEISKEKMKLFVSNFQQPLSLEEELNEDESRQAIIKAMEILTPREKFVISSRFGLGEQEQTLRDTGSIIGVSQARTRQIEAKAIRKLRRGMCEANYTREDLDY